MIRVLKQSDAAALEAFLVQHRDSSMFLRANAARGGIEFHGEAPQCLYCAAFRDSEIVGVVAHSWSGIVLVQAPESCAELARACIADSGRAVTGFSGPLAHVRQARAALGLQSAPAQLDAAERLYALELSALRVPEALASGALVCRAPLPSERDGLCAWRLAYDIELLGAEDSAETRKRGAGFIDWQIAEKAAWVALENGVPVSLSAFNASLPDIVQLGGIYTPPELRGRGYAKASVAGSLLAARARGASRAVLFTQNPSAERSYQSVGFELRGDYGLVLLR